jgi:hypothetical protein
MVGGGMSEGVIVVTPSWITCSGIDDGVIYHISVRDVSFVRLQQVADDFGRARIDVGFRGGQYASLAYIGTNLERLRSVCLID